MYISRLVLDHYRSWDTCTLDLAPGLTLLQGENGLGKTNLVEAVEVLSTGTSHRVSSSLPLVEQGHNTAVIRARINEPDQVINYELTIPVKGSKRGRINSGPSLYMRQLAGHIPCVVFSPDDQRMVSGEPSVRRSFIDQAGVLLDPAYYQSHQSFIHIAQQRSALLKQLSGQTRTNGADRDHLLAGLEIWTGQFIQAGLDLTKRRRDLLDLLAQPFTDLYKRLAGDQQEASLEYIPSLVEVNQGGDDMDASEKSVSEHFQRLYPGEVARGTNLIGPQRDDLAFRLNAMPAREFASNGEMWTLALALRLSLFQVIYHKTGVKPIVVLDDVFAQLDERRREQILEFAERQDQVLVTVAAETDIPKLQGAHLVNVASLRSNGQIVSQDEEINQAMANLLQERPDRGVKPGSNQQEI